MHVEEVSQALFPLSPIHGGKRLQKLKRLCLTRSPSKSRGNAAKQTLRDEEARTLLSIFNSTGDPIGVLAGPFSTGGVALPEYQFHKYGVDTHTICDLLNISSQSRWYLVLVVKS